jgi:hypothetical protein
MAFLFQKRWKLTRSVLLNQIEELVSKQKKQDLGRRHIKLASLVATLFSVHPKG